MKKLNPIATHLIIRFTSLIKTEPISTIYTPLEPPIYLKTLGKVITAEGIGRLISIGKILDKRKKTYSILMEFIIIQNRKARKVTVYPRLFRDDVNGIVDECVQIRRGKVVSYDIVSQKGQADFAFLWLSDLRTEGYLVNSFFLPALHRKQVK